MFFFYKKRGNISIMRRNFLIFTFLITAVSIFVSCGDSGFDDPEEDDYSIELNLTEGSIIKSGQIITFKLIIPEGEEEPESLAIAVYSEAGVKVAENTIDNPKTDTDLELELPQFEIGLYTITFTLYGAEFIIAERSISFFYAEGSYIIKGIESTPLS